MISILVYLVNIVAQLVVVQPLMVPGKIDDTQMMILGEHTQLYSQILCTTHSHQIASCQLLYLLELVRV